LDIRTHTGKIEAAKKVVPILSQIRNAVARGEYVRQSALKLGIREEELLSDVSEFRMVNRMSSPASSSLTARSRQNRPSGQVAAFRKGRGGLMDGTVKAEQCLLALFLTNRDDYERARVALQDELFITPAHRRIKETIYAIGSHFNNLEDLEYKLRDRLAPESEPAAALVEVILKAEEMRQQGEPVEVMLRDFRKRLAKERLNLAAARLLSLSKSGKEDSEQAALQSKIREIGRLGLILPTLTNMSEIDTLERKIEELIGPQEELLQMETTV
jgi:DNA primase